ncbi:MAG: fasciclin domain-containing protein [Phormidesmis sp.]
MQVNNSPRFFKRFIIGLVASSAGAFVALPGAAMPEASSKPAAEALEADAMETDMGTTDADTVEAADIEALSDEAIEASDTMDGEPVEEVVEADTMGEDTMEAEAEMDEESVEADAEMDEESVEGIVEAEPMTEEPVEAAEEMDTSEFTIAELTSNSDSFEVLTAALVAADLVETLSAEGPYTVFAPTDEAFAALPEGAVEQLLLPENKDVLVQILTYHVVPGAVLSTDLETGSVATVEGSDITVEVGDTVTVDNANILLADVEASNGVIHIIDRVILPPAPAANADTDSTEAIQ